MPKALLLIVAFYSFSGFSTYTLLEEEVLDENSLESYYDDENTVSISVITGVAYEYLEIDIDAFDKKSKISNAIYNLRSHNLQFTVAAQSGRAVSGTKLVEHLFDFINFYTGNSVREMDANWSYGINIEDVRQQMSPHMPLWPEDNRQFMDYLYQVAMGTWTANVVRRLGLPNVEILDVELHNSMILTMSVRFCR